MIKFRFNERKITEVAALFIKLNRKRFNYTKLLKLMYLADRQAFAKWNRPITGDTYVSMPYGPVLSNTYTLISYPGDPEQPSVWYQHIATQGYDVKLLIDPGTDTLSKREIALIEEIDKRYKVYDWKAMINICHRDLPEWGDPGNTSLPLPVEKILETIDKTPGEIDQIRDDVEELVYLDTVLAYTH